MSIDEERGIVYIPTGSATADFYGGDRPGQNLFANCLLALDVKTGKRLWHFQTVHHDLWDLDNVSAPQLVTVTHNGKKVDVVAHAGKTGFLYVFNRVTGAPLWPIEERPVEVSQVPMEKSWPTQPFPTKPAPFARQSFTEDDVNPWLLTPEEYEALKERVRKAKNGKGPQGGIFNPTVLNGDAISMPGNQGGSNWGTAAADPQRGLVFVTNVNQVALLRLNDVKDPPAGQGRGGGGGVQVDAGVLNEGRRAYTQYCAACHGADQRGAIPGVPSLVGVTDRIDEKERARLQGELAKLDGADPGGREPARRRRLPRQGAGAGGGGAARAPLRDAGAARAAALGVIEGLETERPDRDDRQRQTAATSFADLVAESGRRRLRRPDGIAVRRGRAAAASTRPTGSPGASAASWRRTTSRWRRRCWRTSRRRGAAGRAAAGRARRGSGIYATVCGRARRGRAGSPCCRWRLRWRSRKCSIASCPCPAASSGRTT